MIFSRHTKRAVGHFCLFLFGLVIIDQSLKSYADRLIHSVYWHDPVYARLSDTTYPHDLAVFGSCRAVGYFRPVDMEPRLGRKIFNAGLLAGGLASLSLTLSIYNSHHTGKDIILVLDDGTLASGFETQRTRLSENLMWWGSLNKAYKKVLSDQFSLSPLDFLPLYSGLWRYRGRGKQLYMSAKRRASHIEVPHVLPGPTYGRMEEESEYISRQTQQWEPDPFAVRLIENLVRQSTASGSRVLLMLPPFHRLRNSDSVNLRIEQTVRNIAKNTGADVVSYLDNKSEIAITSEFWKDPGHMNALGSKQFLTRLSHDLKDIL